MAEAAIAFLLQSLKEEVFQKLELSRIANSELRSLEKDLEEIKKTFQEASRNKSGERFREIESELLDVIYEAEELIDSYLTQELHKKKNRALVQWNRVDLAEKIQNLRTNKLTPAFEKAKKKLDELPMSSVASHEELAKRRNYDPYSSQRVVGMEDEITNYIEILKKSSENVVATSIVGMPGLGKTTVASKIFQDERIRHHFPTVGWFNVSQEPNMAEIYRSIINLFTSKDVSGLSTDALAGLAQKHLRDVKFLLIFDDVWDIGAWKEIKKALPLEGGLGKVLITTRYEQVANHANRNREEKELRFLYQDECWNLLQIQVFGELNMWPPELEKVGRQICEKSGGLPLAIVVIGGILVNTIHLGNYRETEWKKVAETAESYMLTGDKTEGLKSIIELSYDKMRYDLRDCFLYLGICPKDFKMSTWKLKRLWIAEGFIKEDKDTAKSLEVIAEENLMDLITMNLVIVGEKNDRGDVKTCRVHDMIREFCKSKAMNLLKVVKKKDANFHPCVLEIQKARRICVHSHVMEFLDANANCRHVRSFISFSKNETDAEPKTLKSFVTSCKLMRIFEGSSIRFTRFEPKLTQLYHLRYIALNVGDDVKSLPPKFAELVNLQTLVIITRLRELEINADIFEMPRLRHVKSNAAIILKFGEARETSKTLQTLTRLSTKSCNGSMLIKSVSLKTLCLSGKIDSLRHADFVNHLILKKLKLINVMHSENPIAHLWDETKFPPKLEILVLSSTNLIWDYMSIIGRLKNLRVLKIRDNAFNGDEWKIGQGEFDSLRYLEIQRSDLLIWTAAEGSFGAISSLCVRNCTKLLAIPPVVARSLKTLQMGSVSRNALSSGMAIKERGGNLILDAGT